MDIFSYWATEWWRQGRQYVRKMALYRFSDIMVPFTAPLWTVKYMHLHLKTHFLKPPAVFLCLLSMVSFLSLHYPSCPWGEFFLEAISPWTAVLSSLVCNFNASRIAVDANVPLTAVFANLTSHSAALWRESLWISNFFQHDFCCITAVLYLPLLSSRIHLMRSSSSTVLCATFACSDFRMHLLTAKKPFSWMAAIPRHSAFWVMHWQDWSGMTKPLRLWLNVC